MKWKLFTWGFAPMLLVASLLSSAVYADMSESVLLDRALSAAVTDLGWDQPAEANMPAVTASSGIAAWHDTSSTKAGRVEAGRITQSAGSVPILTQSDTAIRLLPGGAAGHTGVS